VTNEYLAEYMCYSMMDRQSPWSVQWFRLVDTIRPVGCIAPHTVPVIAFETGAPSHQFWPPKKPGRPAKAARSGAVPEDPAEDHDVGWDDVAEPSADLDADQGIDDAFGGDECGAPPVEEELLERALAHYILTAEGQAGGNVVDTQLPESEAPGLGPPAPETQAPDHPDLALDPEGGHLGQDSAQPACSTSPLQAESQGPLPSQHMGHRYLGRVMPAASVEVPGGRISYHHSKDAFEATCCNKAHGKCVLTRTRQGRDFKGYGICGGRPVGFLGSWLARHGVDTKEAHWNKAAMQYTHAERLAKRREIQATAAGAALLSFERAKERGEDSEPETLKALL
jgi:hypothetical protein